MKHTKVKITGLFFTLIFLIVSFLFSGLLNDVKTASAETKEEDTIFEYSDYIPDEHGSRSASTTTSHEAESKSVDLTVNEHSTLQVSSSTQDIISSILSEEPFSISGTITVDARSVALNDYYNFSGLSKFDIADWAYKVNLISEKEKIETYCNLIINRNFTNIDCLNDIAEEIRLYTENTAIDFEYRDKINSVLDPRSNFSDSVFSTTAISNATTYSSVNFTFHYDSSRTLLSNVQSTANYMEDVRAKFVNFGFSTPILQSNEKRYNIYLDSASNGNTLAATYKVELSDWTTTCASYIYIYNFNTLDDAQRENMAHEYFHAIQNAYNHQSGWFKEACANWSSITICSEYANTREWINTFIDNFTNVSMPTIAGYASVLFPLTISKNYGGTSAIRSIYEEYSKHYNTNATLNELCGIITNGIVNNGYSSGSFETAYRQMASYLINPSAWFDQSDARNWNKVTPDNVDLSRGSIPFTYGDVDYLATKYFKVTIPAGFSGNVKFELNFRFGGDGEVQTYIVDKNNDPTIIYNRKATDGRIYVDIPYVDGNVSELYFIVSNTRVSSTANYAYRINLEYITYPKNITFSGYNKYIEKVSYIPAGEYAEYDVIVSMNEPVNVIFQTFGEIDTKLELYSQSGVLLASNDDSGYALNALIRYTVSEEISYKLRVKFYNSTQFGKTKIAITTANQNVIAGASALNKYEDIYALPSSANYTYNTVADKNNTRLLRFTPPSSGTYTFELFSNFDNYIYVIDPRYADAIIEDEDYNDNCGQYDQEEGYWTDYNAKLTKNLSANVPYLIIYSGVVPQSYYGSLILKISKEA